MNIADRFSIKKLTTDRLQVLIMGFVSLVTMVLLAVGSEAHASLYQMAAVLLNGGAMLFVSTWLGQDLEPIGKKLVKLGALCIGWLAVLTAVDFLRITHIVTDGLRFSLYTPLLEYLMLLPFGAIRREEKRYRGLELMGAAFSGGAVLLLCMFAMQTFNIIPEGLLDILGRYSMEMRVAWSANIYASVFLIAIGFQMFFIFTVKKRWLKILLALLMVPEYCAIGLTQSRAVVALAAALAAGAVFITIHDGHFRKESICSLLLGILAAGLVLVTLSCCMQALEHLRYARLGDNPKQLQKAISLGKLAAVAFLAVLPLLLIAWSGWLQKERFRKILLVVLAAVFAAAILTGLYLLGAKQSGGESVSLARMLFGVRIDIWQSALENIGKNPRILLTGVLPGEEFPLWVGERQIFHTHNAWIQTLIDYGLVSLILALLLTWAALKNALQLIFSAWASRPQKIVGILILAILGAEIYETNLFFVPCPYQFANIAFLLCTGYAVYWVRREKAHK